MAKKTSSPADQLESTSDLSSSVAHEALVAIRTENRELAGGKDPIGEDRFVRLALLAHKAAMIAAEQRKAEKEDRDNIRDISREVMMTWVKQQSPESRARLVKEIAAIDDKARKSVLAS